MLCPLLREWPWRDLRCWGCLWVTVSGLSLPCLDLTAAFSTALLVSARGTILFTNGNILKSLSKKNILFCLFSCFGKLRFNKYFKLVMTSKFYL